MIRIVEKNAKSIFSITNFNFYLYFYKLKIKKLEIKKRGRAYSTTINDFSMLSDSDVI
jgi:hypothetical protein